MVALALGILPVALTGCPSSLVPAPSVQAREEAGLPPSASTDGTQLARHLPRLQHRGGPFLRHPRIVTITFAGEDPDVAARLGKFGDTITQTPWWSSVAGDLCSEPGDCIGVGRSGLSVRIDEALPPVVRAVEISELLRRRARAGHLGELDVESLLLVYLPEGVGLEDASVPRYCGDGPRGFHRTLRFDGKSVGFGVIPRCGDETALTSTASHELLEIAANPDTARPGFAFVPGSSTHGFTAAGSEPMDPCGLITIDRELVESGFTVRRAWSNRAAGEGHDPCVPAPAQSPYVALMPEQQAVRMRNRGDTTTLSLRAASDRPVGDWAVAAFDLTGRQRHERYLDVALDRTEIGSGETATLHLTLRKLPPTRLIVGIESTLDGRTHLWPLEVLTP